MLPKSKFSPNKHKQPSPKKQKQTHVIDLTLDEPEPMQANMDGVNLILHDNHRTSSNNETEHLCSLLASKLRGKCIKSVSLNFDSSYQLHLRAMKKPFDVKISYNHKLIFISDYGANALFVFDLITKRYLANLTLSKPHYIAIESIVNHREGTENDALIVTSETNQVYKIDIKSSMKSQKVSPIWKVGGSKHFNSPCGVAVYHNKFNDRSNSNSYFRLDQQEHDENLIMVCDFNNNRIQVLGSKYGNLLSSITLIPGIGLQAPWMMDINSNGDLVVSEFSNRVQLIRHVPNIYNYSDIAEREDGSTDGWVSIHQFSSESKTRNLKTKSCGIVVDKTTQNVIICDRDSNIVRVFNVNGVFIKEVRGIVNKPRGICIDETSGEVLIVDSENKNVRIFGHIN